MTNYRTPLLITFSMGVLILGGYIFINLKGTPGVRCRDMNPEPTIVAFGDSLVDGYGASTRGGFVTMLATSLDTPIINEGRNGDTTQSAQTRLNDVLSIKPDIVLLLLGGNDVLQQTPPAETKRNLGEMIEQLQAQGTKVILLGVIGGIGIGDPFKDMFDELRDTYDVAYVPNVLSGLLGHQEYMSDPIHPNEAGYRKIADKVLPVLEDVCTK